MQRIKDLAVFVLATTKGNREYSAYEHRIVEIATTWGSAFHNLYFVLGTNIFDYKFLTDNCYQADAGMAATPNHLYQQQNRRLKAHSPQTTSNNVVNEYTCPRGDLNVDIKFLWIANCTGEYFGIGPTCRCQEAMRYYNNHPGLGNWFGFFDDDMHLRPYALTSMLKEHNRRQMSVHSPVGFVSATVYRSFQFSKRWDPKIHNCSVQGVHDFPLAQPAFLNRQAMDKMKAAINANTLTKLQNVWGGTHDTLLGMLLWLHKIPLFSFADSFFGDEMIYEDPKTIKCDRSKIVILHRAQRRRWVAKGGDLFVPRPMRARNNNNTMPRNLLSTSTVEGINYLHLFGQVDLAMCFHDWPLYAYFLSTNRRENVSSVQGWKQVTILAPKSRLSLSRPHDVSTSNQPWKSIPTVEINASTEAAALAVMHEQIAVGTWAASLALALVASGVDQTKRAILQRGIMQPDFGGLTHVFHPEDC